MITLGQKEFSNILFGNKEISSIKKGESELWSNFKILDLGTGTSFNVANVYSKYDRLTVDNFYTNTSSAYQNRGGVTDAGTTMRTIKSYNAQTGILTFYLGWDSGMAGTVVSLHAYLVVNNDKAFAKGIIKNLGTAMSINIQSVVPEYETLTNRNFFVREVPYVSASKTCYVGPERCSLGAGFSRSYSNGVVSWSNQGDWFSSGGTPTIYYIPDKYLE